VGGGDRPDAAPSCRIALCRAASAAAVTRSLPTLEHFPQMSTISSCFFAISARAPRSSPAISSGNLKVTVYQGVLGCEVKGAPNPAALSNKIRPRGASDSATRSPAETRPPNFRRQWSCLPSRRPETSCLDARLGNPIPVSADGDVQRPTIAPVHSRADGARAPPRPPRGELDCVPTD